MATSTLSYTGPADGNTSLTFTHTGTIVDNTAPQFFAAYRDAYGNYFDAVANTVTQSPTNSAGANNAVATDAQIFEKYAKGIADGTAAHVQRYVETQAIKQALASVAPVSVTQTV